VRNRNCLFGGVGKGERRTGDEAAESMAGSESKLAENLGDLSAACRALGGKGGMGVVQAAKHRFRGEPGQPGPSKTGAFGGATVSCNGASGGFLSGRWSDRLP
jgi:hypothetical protein